MEKTINPFIPLITLTLLGIFLRINREVYRFTEFLDHRIFLEHTFNYIWFALLLFGLVFFISRLFSKEDREKWIIFIFVFIVTILLAVIGFIWENTAGRSNTPEQNIPNLIGILIGVIWSWFIYFKKIK
jgi:VanZ family protein